MERKQNELRSKDGFKSNGEMKKIKSIIFFCLIASNLLAQQMPPFWNEIRAFKTQDSIQFPPRNAILFIGSSSFTMWKDVQRYFPGYTIINRGFGGSSLPDVTRYTSDIIFPYQPKQIIIYCGENDLASSDSVSANMVYSRFQQLFMLIRKKLPSIPIAYISMKPSPARQHLMPKMRKANELIKNFLKKKRKTAYIDVYNAMIDDEGKPFPELFIEDLLHMNEKGYDIWQKVIEPYLIK